MLFTSEVSPVSWLAWQGQSERDYINVVISEVSNVTVYCTRARTHFRSGCEPTNPPDLGLAISWLVQVHLWSKTITQLCRAVWENLKEKKKGGGGVIEHVRSSVCCRLTLVLLMTWLQWRMNSTGAAVVLAWWDQQVTTSLQTFIVKHTAPVTPELSKLSAHSQCSCRF